MLQVGLSGGGVHELLTQISGFPEHQLGSTPLKSPQSQRDLTTYLSPSLVIFRLAISLLEKGKS